MKIILLDDLPPLGRKNDVKEVSNGYARNFLFPKKLAKLATPEALKELTSQKEREERKKSEEYQKYNALAERLKPLVLTFKVKVGEKGRTFGSITVVKIHEALKKEGIEAKKEWIELEEPIKTTGEHMVKVKFPHGLEGEIKIKVEAE